MTLIALKRTPYNTFIHIQTYTFLYIFFFFLTDFSSVLRKHRIGRVQTRLFIGDLFTRVYQSTVPLHKSYNPRNCKKKKKLHILIFSFIRIGHEKIICAQIKLLL